MKKFITVAFIMAYAINASAVLLHPIRSNNVSDFELSLVIAAKSLNHKKTWAQLKFSQKQSALALKNSAKSEPVAAMDPDLQKREIANVERDLKENLQPQTASTSDGGGNTITSSSTAPEPRNEVIAEQEQPQEQPRDPEPPMIIVSEPAPVVVNDHANDHANNNAQNNSNSEPNSQNNSSNGNENSNAGGNSDKEKGKKK